VNVSLRTSVGTWLARGLAACAIAVSAGVTGQPAFAAPTGSEQLLPAVELSSNEVDPDDMILVTIAGFSSRTVTVTVCGNGALRGSGDCNMAASESTRINDDGSPRHVELIVSAPPMPCPCLIRVSSPTNDEAAVAPITITGHPSAEPIAGSQTDLPLVVSMRASPVTDGFVDSVRSSLGGPTTFDVTITIRNTATELVDGISVSASAGRRPGHVLAVIDVPPPPAIAAGATWEQTVRVDLPAPVWGDVRWAADISGGDNTVEATDHTSSLPVLLIVAIGVLLFVVVALSWRLVLRVRRRRAGERALPKQLGDGTANYDLSDQADQFAEAGRSQESELDFETV
jgi:hypothetical protein